jgi:predicted ester cyclase
MADWQTPIQKMMADVPAELLDVAMGVGQVFTTLDPAAAEKFIHKDFVDHEASPGIGGGPEGYLATARYMNAAFTDATWMPQVIFASGDKYAMAMEFSGIHSGDFLGVKATGKKVNIRHLHFFRVQNGQAIEHWGARDELTLLAQIGEFNPSHPNPADAGAVAAYA